MSSGEEKRSMHFLLSGNLGPSQANSVVIFLIIIYYYFLSLFFIYILFL